MFGLKYNYRSDCVFTSPKKKMKKTHYFKTPKEFQTIEYDKLRRYERSPEKKTPNIAKKKKKILFQWAPYSKRPQKSKF